MNTNSKDASKQYAFEWKSITNLKSTVKYLFTSSGDLKKSFLS